MTSPAIVHPIRNPAPPSAPAFLGVERSVSGKRWEARSTDDRLGLALAQRFDLAEIVGRVLAGRGVGLEAAEAFLNPSLRSQMPDPSHLRDMDRAVTRLVTALKRGEQVAVFGDYDVDGATSSALLARYFETLGAPLRVYIPDRIKEGYGPNLSALRKLRDQGVDVVVTVDCGVTSFDALSGAKAAGLDVLVVDHHAAEPNLPDAVAVVNPNRLDDPSPHGALAAVGVTFLLLVALNRRLRAEGLFADRPEPDLRGLLDLVALGTVADVVPLVGLNRVFVTQGLKVMAGRGNFGLAALADVAGVDQAPGAYHLGYQLGPRVNAGGRVGEPDLGVRLLSGNDPNEAMRIARDLDRYNQERKALEAACLDEAVRQVEASEPSEHLIYAAGADWHPGVIGIVASRLKELYNRPACVVALTEGVGKGSGRSVAGVDLGAAVIAARQEGLLLNGGGHKMAAGFTVAEAGQADFIAFLEGRIAAQMDGAPITPRLGLDGALSVAGATLDLIDQLERLAPFGAGNAQPRFVLTEARIDHADVVGRDHVRCRLGGGGAGGLKSIAFRAADQELGAFLLSKRGGGPAHIAGRLQVDRWQGREQPQLIIDDAAPVD
ncbi:MAG: single-stranded-DNA-specific exonuclease RecJ [Alphaproteobacteria bacterium]|nr:single-stranded-DNA-specific exonuclease RecJ [Alphaproteobacteria bacterium]